MDSTKSIRLPLLSVLALVVHGSAHEIPVTSSVSLVQKHAVVRKQPRRRVYLDLGANWANTLRLYRDIGDAGEVEAGPWEVYAFEASPLIMPYAEAFVAWLNGAGPRPRLQVPPAGSTYHLSRFARRYGCGCRDDGEMRECMWRTFAAPLRQLRPNVSLMGAGLIARRLAEAKVPAVGPDRFVFIPAAAGATSGSLNLGDVNAEQMVRGGASGGPPKGQGRSPVSVPMVDFVSWLTENFRDEDYVVAKVDIEGSEFPVFQSLLDRGRASLIDVLALECHGGHGDCKGLLGRLRRQMPGGRLFEEGGSGYHGWDSCSAPEHHYPEDPRGRAP